MVTTGGKAVFIDTQILVYAAGIAMPLYSTARCRLVDLEQSGRELCVSRQVLREFMVVMTRPGTLSKPVSVPEVLDQVHQIVDRISVLEDGPAVTDKLFELLIATPTTGKQVHDANIVATMLVHGVRCLLTHNLDDFRRFEPWIQILPLLTEAKV